MKKERNRGAYYDSLIRKMSTIIFLISLFLTKKEGKVSIFFSITSPCYFYEIFMVGAALSALLILPDY